LRVSDHDPGHLLDIGLPFVFLVIAFIATNWRKILRKITSGTAGDWTTASAKIEVVSAVEQLREGRYGDEITGYLATLTYFYRNPELQMGEYTRFFPLKASAQAWADQFKDRQVVIHVNPRDLTDSVLMDADLEGLSPAAAPSLEDAVRMEQLPRLKPGYLMLSGLSEIVALGGLCMSLAALWTSIRMGTLAWPHWVVWTGVAMLAFNLASVWLVTYRAEDSNSYRAFIYGYKLWCPAWMRWGVNISGVLVFVLGLAMKIQRDLPAGVQSLLLQVAPHIQYLVACFGFLSTGAVHVAILRSQELTRTEPSGASTEDAASN